MSELEEKLGALLSNPQLMQQISAMAQSLGASQPQKEEPHRQQEPPPSPLSGLDPKLLQGLAGMAGSGRVDQNQEALLCALSPYLSQGRVSKLERAMRAARLANAASAFLNSGGLQLLGGR